jgi:hypothetical protein
MQGDTHVIVAKPLTFGSLDQEQAKLLPGSLAHAGGVWQSVLGVGRLRCRQDDCWDCLLLFNEACLMKRALQ